MTWRDESVNGELIISNMDCDFCDDSIIWYNKDDDYDNPTIDDINNAKKTDGWATISIHKYEDDKEHPTDIEVSYIDLHLCPKCRKEKLGLLIIDKKEPNYIIARNCPNCDCIVTGDGSNEKFYCFNCQKEVIISEEENV